MPVTGVGAVVVTTTDGPGRLTRDAGVRDRMRLDRPWLRLTALISRVGRAHDARRVLAQTTSRASWRRPPRISTGQPYDGSSYFVPIWIEAFGFCRGG